MPVRLAARRHGRILAIMVNHPSTDAGEHNLPVLSVAEVSHALKRQIETTFDRVRVRGEITGCRRPGSGHLYFALKDPDAMLKAVVWRSAAPRLGIRPEDGMEVIVTGRLTTYPGRSEYQIVADSVELAGEGALLKLLEHRRKALAAEGLFDEARKKPLPFMPTVVGVVTSPTGAVIRDILHRIADRCPCHVVVWPVLVQGEGAAEQIAAAIAGFNNLGVDAAVPPADVLIIARGGGSLEDLWAFNEEVVVRAAAASTIPLISAVGHETDVTLIDFAADRRAPTPTAAAEMAVPVRLELAAQVADDGLRLSAAARRLLEHGKVRLDGLARGLPRPQQLVHEARQRLDERSERLDRALLVGLDRQRDRLARISARVPDPRPQIDHARSRLAAEARALASTVRGVLTERVSRLAHAGALLESYSYQRVLERGFVLVTDADGRTCISARTLSAGTSLRLRFHDGQVGVVVGDKGPAKRTTPGRSGDGGQGSLL